MSVAGRAPPGPVGGGRSLDSSLAGGPAGRAGEGTGASLGKALVDSGLLGGERGRGERVLTGGGPRGG